MRKLLISAVLAITVSAGAIAYAQTKDDTPMQGVRAQPLDTQAPAPSMTTDVLPPQSEVAASDARSLASDQAVGEARRYYRAQCNQYESAAFCDCVTAGVAQVLMPEEVRIAGRTILERITAQGDTGSSEQTDATPAMSSAERIEQVEGHYADACASYRS
ncbi:MAG: hypothetical protein NT015_15860 [Alphaproteobacteria bacterium]|nr:hypothetical protein [Alphaproteobacteria bacterium]